MGYYAKLKGVYRAMVPAPLRRLTWDRRYPFHRALDPVKLLLQRHAPHDEVYDRSYYQETVEPEIRRSASLMARSIRDELGPRRVVDVGCGTGELLLALRELGIDGSGLERSRAAIEIARAKGLEIEAFDLEGPPGGLPERRGDLVISTEVAEHLTEPFADPYVDYLCRCGDLALITAATPGQGGTDHVNEQPNAYWIAKFEARGWRPLEDLTRRLRREWSAAGVASFYSANLLLFRGPAAGDAAPR